MRQNRCRRIFANYALVFGHLSASGKIVANPASRLCFGIRVTNFEHNLVKIAIVGWIWTNT